MPRCQKSEQIGACRLIGTWTGGCITQTIAHRVARYLEKTGYLVRDAEFAYLDLPAENDDPWPTFSAPPSPIALPPGPMPAAMH